MNESSLVLHATTKSLLDSLAAKPAHAVLLSGPVGIGKTHIARHIGARLLGTATTKLENQPYYREIIPEKETISIDQIRALIRFFRLSVPGATRVKRVAVIQDSETMGREAQNALLKLLEEPPEGSVLILTSSYPDQLLPTVRSRTQILTLPAPEPAELLAYFTAQGHESPDVQRALLRAGTNVAEAVRLLDATTAESDQALQLVKQVLSGSTYDRMLLVDGLAKQKEQAREFVTTLAATAVASLQAAAAKNNTASLPKWHNILQAADVALSAFERSGNAKLVLTELMLAL